MNYKKFTGLNDDIIKIRATVFIDEQGFKDEFDKTDKTCTHIVLYDNEKPIATCRYFKESENYHIGRVAIIKEYRGQGLGNKVMQIAETEILQAGGQTIEVSAQVRVSEFYKKLGYNKVGDIYFDEYCEHIRMIKEIQMFRPMRRIKQQLSQEECISILKNEVRGVLSVLGDNGYPYGIPMNFYYSVDENKIYFHGSREGHKIDAIKNCDKVSFCTHDKGVQSKIKKGLDVKSVIAFGRIKIVEDFDKSIDICRKLSSQFDFGSEFIEDEIKKFGKFVMVLELTPEHITGKIINES